MNKTIHQLIRKQEKDYTTGNTQISEHVRFSVKENVDKIEAYLNSKHISGETDSLGREKPFFNIVTAAVNVWFRATDIDRANIRIKATKSSDHIAAVLANVKLQEWMRRENFGAFLNDWGRTLVRYGSAIVKFTQEDGRLVPTVVPWNRILIDNVDFESTPKIEKLYLTPAQLRTNPVYDQDVVKALLDSQLTSRAQLDGDKKDTKDDFIEVYEVHGLLEESYLTGKDDDEDYVQQVHICAITQGQDKGEYQDFTLYSGREKDPYMLTHLIKEDGRSMAIGAVEHLFEAQWMVNHNEKSIKDQLDLASKLVFQTSDPNFASRNVLEMDNGLVLLHEPNQPLTELANTGHDVTSLLSSKQEWRNQGQESTGTPDAMRGNTMPSGTAARQVEALQQESHSLFELMTENKGISIEEMVRTFVIPHIKKQLDTKDEIAATLDDLGIRQIDMMYVPNEAKRRYAKKAIEAVLNGQEPGVFDPTAGEREIADELKPLGSQRYFKPDELDNKTWKEVFKDLEWQCEVEVTNEAHDKQATLTTLSTVLQQLAAMGDVENAKTVLNKILEETGVFSPMELVTQITPTAPPQPAPTS